MARAFFPAPTFGHHMRTRMRLDVVTEIINHGKLTEHRSNHLQQALATQVRQLPPVIWVNGESADRQLLGFITEYIELVPATLSCIGASAREAGLELLFQPFLLTASDYFLRPSLAITRNAGLDSLMVRAYQCHRLIEELYENNLSLRSNDACKLELTPAGLIVHHLIGEPFANELDQAALRNLGELVEMPEYYSLDLGPYIATRHGPNWQALSERWAQLLPRHGIRLHFPSES